MAMNSTPASGEVLSELNTTPLIDVLLVLLVLLLITLPMQSHAINLNMPERAIRLTVPPPVVDLRIDFDGQISWNGQRMDRATADAMFKHVATLTTQPEIHLSADRLVRYDIVAKILADAQRSGVTNIDIVNTNEDVQ